MRAVAAAATAAWALVCAAPADAALRWDFVRKQAVAVGPDAPAGKAVAVCAASAAGELSGCRLLLDEPGGGDLGSRLLAAAAGYRLAARPKRCAAKLDKASIATSAPLADVGPAWLQRPTFEDMYRVYPREALRQKLRASVVLACEVAETGGLEACRALFVDGAEGVGFEAAAVALAPVFKLTPAQRAGRPVRGFVTIPINFYPKGPPC